MDIQTYIPMHTYIALLRGVNVGGANKLPMRQLAETLAGLGLHNVRTYIQSGNVVLQSEQADRAALAGAITEAIRAGWGFAPYALILSVEEMAAALAANPFPAAAAEPKTLHLFFLDAAPQAVDTATLERRRAADEHYQLIDRVFYLHTPSGIGRSKLAESIGKGWGVQITARNWRTASEVLALARSLAAGSGNPEG